jgi:hypothetical protein
MRLPFLSFFSFFTFLQSSFPLSQLRLFLFFFVGITNPYNNNRLAALNAPFQRLWYLKSHRPHFKYFPLLWTLTPIARKTVTGSCEMQFTAAHNVATSYLMLTSINHSRNSVNNNNYRNVWFYCYFMYASNLRAIYLILHLFKYMRKNYTIEMVSTSTETTPIKGNDNSEHDYSISCENNKKLIRHWVWIRDKVTWHWKLRTAKEESTWPSQGILTYLYMQYVCKEICEVLFLESSRNTQRIS